MAEFDDADFDRRLCALEVLVEVLLAELAESMPVRLTSAADRVEAGTYPLAETEHSAGTIAAVVESLRHALQAPEA